MTTKEITGRDLQFREIAELYKSGDKEIEKVFKRTVQKHPIPLTRHIKRNYQRRG